MEIDKILNVEHLTFPKFDSMLSQQMLWHIKGVSTTMTKYNRITPIAKDILLVHCSIRQAKLQTPSSSQCFLMDEGV